MACAGRRPPALGSSGLRGNKHARAHTHAHTRARTGTMGVRAGQARHRARACLRVRVRAPPRASGAAALPRAFGNAVTLRTERKKQRTWTQGTLSSMGTSCCAGAGPASGAPASSPQLAACDISRRSWMSFNQVVLRCGAPSASLDADADPRPCSSAPKRGPAPHHGSG